MFASRTDLLDRTNVRRLFQIAAPTDVPMAVDDDALRVAINGGSLAGFTAADQTAVTLALARIDKALQDATDTLLAYRVPADASSGLLTRLAATLAWYYLLGDNISAEDQRAFDTAMQQLRDNARGTLGLVPITPSESANLSSASDVSIFSGAARYTDDATTNSFETP